MRNELTTTAVSVRKLAACRANWQRRGPLTDAGRERIRAACLRSRPWLRSTGPRTAAGKQWSRENAVTYGKYARVVEPFGTAHAMTRRLLALGRESAGSLDGLYEALSTAADEDHYCEVAAAIVDVLENPELLRLYDDGVSHAMRMLTDAEATTMKREFGLVYHGAILANAICEARNSIVIRCIRWHSTNRSTLDRLLAQAVGALGGAPSVPSAH